MSSDDIGRGGSGAATRVTRWPETWPRSYASACFVDFINSPNVSSLMYRRLAFFVFISRLSLDRRDNLSQCFRLGRTQVALFILGKQKYQMNAFCVAQVKINVPEASA